MHGVPARRVKLGREICAAADLPRHRHSDGYLTVVLGGSYGEAGDAGRFRAEAGVVLVHRAFEAHRDSFHGRHAQVLNLPLPPNLSCASALRVDNLDDIVRASERDLQAASELVTLCARAGSAQDDWPDLLAAELRRPCAPRIVEWAERNRLDPATVSRGFFQAFGTTAVRYRAEARTRLALRALMGGGEPLAQIAAQLGFSDQAHMTRSVRAMTGVSPASWRRRVNSIQDVPPRLA